MKISLAKIIALFLMLLTACPYINFFSREAAQEHIRHEMEERLEQGMLQTISLRETEVIWAEKGKEAWINGRLFDIKSSRISNGYIIITGLYDDEETMVVKNMLQDQHKHNAGSSRIVAGFFQVFGFTQFDTNDVFNGFTLSTMVFIPVKVNIFSPTLPVITPPPRFSCI